MRPPQLNTPEANLKRIEGIRAAKARIVDSAPVSAPATIDYEYIGLCRKMRNKGDKDALAISKWVAEGIEWHGLATRHRKEFDWLSAPCVEAMSLLRWVLKDPENENTFWQSMWSKKMPSRSQIDQMGAVIEPCRNLTDWLDSYRQIAADAQG